MRHHRRVRLGVAKRGDLRGPPSAPVARRENGDEPARRIVAVEGATRGGVAVGAVGVARRGLLREPPPRGRGVVEPAVKLDLVVAALAGWLAILATDGSTTRPEWLLCIVLIPMAIVGSFALSRCYEPRYLGVGTDDYRRVFDVALNLVQAP